MARPRTPTAVLEARNSFRKHPERRRGAEPKCTGPLGEPPARLDRREKAAWREIAAMLGQGVGENGDRLMFEVLCKLAVRVQKDGIGGRGGATAGEISQLNSISAKFGLTPADRAKLSVPQPSAETENVFAQLAKQASPQGPALKPN